MTIRFPSMTLFSSFFALTLLSGCSGFAVDTPDVERLATAIEGFNGSGFSAQPDLIGTTTGLLAIDDYLGIVTDTTADLLALEPLTNQLQGLDALTGITSDLVNGELLVNGLSGTTTLAGIGSLTTHDGLTNVTDVLSNTVLLTQDLIGIDALNNENSLNLTTLLGGVKQ